jgi:hypothetical protein
MMLRFSQGETLFVPDGESAKEVIQEVGVSERALP